MLTSQEGLFYIGIGAIIEHNLNGKILLLRRCSEAEFAPNIWDDVGGRMRDLELPEETLKREIFEETGIEKLEILKPIDVSHYYRGEKKPENQMVVITYWCKTPSMDIKLSPEHDKYKWVSPEDAFSLLTDTNLKRNVKRFIEEKKLF